MSRKVLYALVIIIMAIAAIPGIGRYGINLFGISISLNSDKEYLEKSTYQFLESIKFKDFEKAAVYHHPERLKSRDIPALIEKRFMVKPELLDISSFEILLVEIDSTGDRARVKTRSRVSVLNSGKERDLDLIFYWQREKGKDGKWYMTLDSSLQ
ncbi:MAG: hypothetical protein CVV64_09835 [Candidatus Wallbacteria bacterium HGW-Wallbacteria-1]|jgi:hypothetical protein|uniref:DUF4440 domain-containing protein n=1 Tax=Candidatus Wallbacteria bacterium HGW-Wallbacteria-1 TaxID=2013854 RepID=A0A2N1PPJ1_9BACT|nr:MAG: hypothetical protein CVV64_09835 [Candidatus Wallbacteria bacterium HGW-Wallbacteria-1]